MKSLSSSASKIAKIRAYSSGASSLKNKWPRWLKIREFWKRSKKGTRKTCEYFKVWTLCNMQKLKAWNRRPGISKPQRNNLMTSRKLQAKRAGWETRSKTPFFCRTRSERSALTETFLSKISASLSRNKLFYREMMTKMKKWLSRSRMWKKRICKKSRTLSWRSKHLILRKKEKANDFLNN